ncbi:MAG: helix-turn-helix transcriptional regulator [Gammaproteobacteria bacterium]|nr:helix-turn-helix transcriptional regulator [Gammaproteobacteria bacterium]
MSQYKAIVQAVKNELKKQGKTYFDLARELKLSESTVKRMFALNAISLERLDQICLVLGMEIIELVQSIERDKKRIEQLSHEQEKELASNTKLLLVALSLLNMCSYAEILETYDISEFESIKLMAKLDRMQIIELLPGNRVKLKISRNFSWRPNGPIQKFYEKSVKAEYFDCQFNGLGEMQLFVTGMLSKQSNSELIKKMRKLAEEFNSNHDEDSSLRLEDRFGTSMVLAIRPWELKAFNDLRRPDKGKVF